ncbi:hypothetical protein FNE76_01850 [Helicobacter mehlei]|uniref:Uncharacterized protein n=1 Tax=Helicobacter mehlei TaxID=2316080 RepID=A0A553V192_9HELI|nr:hypothetical protein FNE76_01850 [Helicobacter mehlei]
MFKETACQDIAKNVATGTTTSVANTTITTTTIIMVAHTTTTITIMANTTTTMMGITITTTKIKVHQPRSRRGGADTSHLLALFSLAF